MTVQRQVITLIAIGTLLCLEPAIGQEATKDASSSNPTAAIRAAAKDFVAAFNRGDAKALAAHWTSNGEYVNESGQRFNGQPAIQAEYDSFFKQFPGVAIHVQVDSIRLIGNHTAIEDGRAALNAHLPGPPAISKYVAVHVKQDGKWLMASVRDTRMEMASHYHQIADLEWLIGNWVSEHEGVRLENSSRWIGNKNFIERKHKVLQGGQLNGSGTEIIGWDPAAQAIKSWMFDSTGGHAVGVWSQHDKGWVVEMNGVTADGSLASATNVLSRVTDEAMVWRSVKRTAGGEPLPDTEETLLKRQ